MMVNTFLKTRQHVMGIKEGTAAWSTGRYTNSDSQNTASDTN